MNANAGNNQKKNEALYDYTEYLKEFSFVVEEEDATRAKSPGEEAEALAKETLSIFQAALGSGK